MKTKGIILLAWWLYVGTFAFVPSYPYAFPYPVWHWMPKKRFLHQEFCELNARQLRREGLDAFCRYVDD